MSADPQQRTQLPIACTLGPDEGADRIAQWRRLIRRSLIDREETPGLLTLRFRSTDEVAAELTRLVEAERSCCSFLDWALVNDGETCTLRIAGDDEAVRTLSLS